MLYLNVTLDNLFGFLRPYSWRSCKGTIPSDRQRKYEPTKWFGFFIRDHYRILCRAVFHLCIGLRHCVDGKEYFLHYIRWHNCTKGKFSLVELSVVPTGGYRIQRAREFLGWQWTSGLQDKPFLWILCNAGVLVRWSSCRQRQCPVVTTGERSSIAFASSSTQSITSRKIPTPSSPSCRWI